MNIEDLKKIQRFSDIGTAELKPLFDKLDPVQIEPKEYLFKEGDRANELYFLISGKMKVLKTCGPGRTEEISTLSAPNIIGEMAFLIDTPRVASIVALEPCRLLKFKKSDFQQMLQQQLPIIQKLLLFFSEVLSHRLYELDSKVCSIIENSASKGKTAQIAELEAFRNKLYSQWSF